MAARDEQPCFICLGEIDSNEAGISFPMFGRTVGIQPRFQSESRLAYVCVDCCIGISAGAIEVPRGKPLYMIAYQIVKDVVAQNPAFIVEFWKNLRKKAGLPPMLIPSAGDLPGEILPPTKRLAS